MASATAAPDDGAYAAAATAIERRDYAEALDQLQAARERKPDDVRVLNAFGVVYDKLGRFDLSARYYGQAKALDPSSAIVEHNLAYSSELQGRLQPASASPVVAPPAAIVMSNPIVAPASAPGVLKTSFVNETDSPAPVAATAASSI